jgi:hypothetical protein
VAKDMRHRQADLLTITLVQAAPVERWLRRQARTHQEAVEKTLLHWQRGGARAPGPAAPVPAEEVFRTSIRLDGATRAVVLEASRAVSLAPETLVNGIVAEAAGRKRAVRFAEGTPGHSRQRAARLVFVYVDPADLEVLDEIRGDAPRREILGALLDAWIASDCPRLRDVVRRRGARRTNFASTISLEHADALRRGCLAAGMVPGGALRALVHGLAGVPRGSSWPGLGVAAKRTVASLVVTP